MYVDFRALQYVRIGVADQFCVNFTLTMNFLRLVTLFICSKWLRLFHI